MIIRIYDILTRVCYFVSWAGDKKNGHCTSINNSCPVCMVALIKATLKGSSNYQL